MYKFVDLNGLQVYSAKLKEWIEKQDSEKSEEVGKRIETLETIVSTLCANSGTTIWTGEMEEYINLKDKTESHLYGIEIPEKK